MPVKLSKKFKFEAAHKQVTFPNGHQCANLHGHSFKLEVFVTGEIDPKTGILIEFDDIKAVVKPLVDLLDHSYINELGEKMDDDLLKIPTAENLSKWFYHKIKPNLPMLSSVIIQETDTCTCEYFE